MILKMGMLIIAIGYMLDLYKVMKGERRAPLPPHLEPYRKTADVTTLVISIVSTFLILTATGMIWGVW